MAPPWGAPVAAVVVVEGDVCVEGVAVDDADGVGDDVGAADADDDDDVVVVDAVVAVGGSPLDVLVVFVPVLGCSYSCSRCFDLHIYYLVVDEDVVGAEGVDEEAVAAACCIVAVVVVIVVYDAVVVVADTRVAVGGFLDEVEVVEHVWVFEV